MYFNVIKYFKVRSISIIDKLESLNININFALDFVRDSIIIFSSFFYMYFTFLLHNIVLR